MNKITQVFINNAIKDIKRIAKDNAVRYGKDDEGFNVTITGEEIKKETNRKRLDTSVTESIVKKIQQQGIDAELIDKNIIINVQPILSKKDSLSLQELRERQSVIDELNTKETWEFIQNS